MWLAKVLCRRWWPDSEMETQALLYGLKHTHTHTHTSLRTYITYVCVMSSTCFYICLYIYMYVGYMCEFCYSPRHYMGLVGIATGWDGRLLHGHSDTTTPLPPHPLHKVLSVYYNNFASKCANVLWAYNMYVDIIHTYMICIIVCVCV